MTFGEQGATRGSVSSAPKGKGGLPHWEDPEPGKGAGRSPGDRRVGESTAEPKDTPRISASIGWWRPWASQLQRGSKNEDGLAQETFKPKAGSSRKFFSITLMDFCSTCHHRRLSICPLSVFMSTAKTIYA